MHCCLLPLRNGKKFCFKALTEFPPSKDIVDIKPVNMEELTEVITAAVFHPIRCNEFVYSSSKGTIRLCDMRQKALCDAHAKCKLPCRGFIQKGLQYF